MCFLFAKFDRKVYLYSRICWKSNIGMRNTGKKSDKSGKDYHRHSALTNLLSTEEYGINEALVLNNGSIEMRGNVLCALIYMAMFLNKSHVQGDTHFVLDMKGLR